MRSIIISDIHLSGEDRYAQISSNKKYLVRFLNRLGTEIQLDELIINGDFLEQWNYPADCEVEASSDAFYKEIAAYNQPIFDALKRLIARGIRLVYIPGNHDMTLSRSTLDDLLPGIMQARDVQGLGHYRTGARGEILIEHGHRYEIFCAPDSMSNQEWTQYGQPILPAGYLYSRLKLAHIAQRSSSGNASGTPIPQPGTGMFRIDPNTARLRYAQEKLETLSRAQITAAVGNNLSDAEFGYRKLWESLVNRQFNVGRALDEPFMQIHVDGFQGEFSLNDMIPQIGEGGLHSRLFDGIWERWPELQRRNQVASPVSSNFAFQNAIGIRAHEQYAVDNYFHRDPSVEVVVFGHSHKPVISKHAGGKVFANAGTWVDQNRKQTGGSRTFLVIDSDAETKVTLCRVCDDDSTETIE